MSATVLVVDDEAVQRRLVEATLSRMGYKVETADGGESALQRLSDASARPVDLILLDLVMPDLDGMGVLDRIKKMGLSIPVIVQTSQGSIDTVVSAMRAGAQDFVVKPASAERLQVSLSNALQIQDMGAQVRQIKNRSQNRLGFDDLVTNSPAMDRVIEMSRKAASSNIPVLVEGESGVGKEIIARAIQGSGSRASKPFVIVNCGAIPENLVESILFGHEKGAFTGATDNHLGKFREAHGGTLFLDEVGELPHDIQVKLLRALQEGEIDPVGSNQSVKVDFRLISATNCNLLDAVKAGTFREDLFYRLNVFPIRIPPLRERKEDIPDLVKHFLARFALEEGRRAPAIIGRNVLDMLSAFDWPGNIRQLENTIFRALILCNGVELTVHEFPQITSLIGGYEAPVSQITSDEVRSNRLLQVGQSSPSMATHTNVDSMDDKIYGFTKLADDQGQIKSLCEIEKEAISFALDFHNQHMTKVAKSLNIGRSTLYRKLREYGLEEAVEITD